MKRSLFILSLCTVLYSCSNNKNSATSQDTLAASDLATAARQPEVDTAVNNIGTDRSVGAKSSGYSGNGAQLIASSDCSSCHSENKKLVGPSYHQIAEKYEDNEANVKYLAGTIVKGGSGVWGEIPMSPHPTVNENDAMEMAKYILSLK